MKINAAQLDALAQALILELPEVALQDRASAEMAAAVQVLRETPFLSGNRKRLEELFAKRFLQPVWGAMLHLLRSESLRELSRLAGRFQDRRLAEGEARPVVVRSSVPLQNEELRSLRERLEKRFGAPVTLTEVADATAVGGFVLRSGDWEYDATIQGKVSRLREQFV